MCLSFKFLEAAQSFSHIYFRTRFNKLHYFFGLSVTDNSSGIS